MANEILYAGVADQRTAEILSGDYLMLIANRESLPSHPALFYAGDLRGRGSSTIKVPHIGLFGYDLPVQTAEGASVANTALTDGATTITVAKYSKAYERGDMARFTDSTGLLDASKFALDSAMSQALALTNSLANLVDNFATTAGASGVNLSAANVLTAIGSLEVNVQAAIPEGAVMGVLHTQQMADLRSDVALTTGGALQWFPETYLQLPIKGAGYRGRFLGIDWFANPFVPTANAGADRAGGIFVRGAILWADMGVDTENDPNALNIGGKVLFERDRNARAGSTAWVNHGYHGASEGIDLLGCSVITDA